MTAATASLGFPSVDFHDPKVYHLDGTSGKPTGSKHKSQTSNTQSKTSSELLPNFSGLCDKADSTSRSSKDLYLHSGDALTPMEDSNGDICEKDVYAQKQRSERRKTVQNLQAASLSTPELHLSSDPMYDMDDFTASHSRPGLLEFTRPQTNVAETPPRISTDTARYTSFASAMDAVTSDNTPEKHRHPEERNRKPSSVTIRESDISSSAGRISEAGSTASSATIGNANTPSKAQNSNGPYNSMLAGQSYSAAEAVALQSKRNGTSSEEQSRRPRGWLARRFTAAEAERYRTGSPTVSSCTPVALSESASDLSSTNSLATAGSGSTQFTRSTSLTASGTATSLGVDTRVDPILAIEDLRTARCFLIEQLSDLTLEQMGETKVIIANLAWIHREKEAEGKGIEIDFQREIFEFWRCISSGVLLCLVMNRLRPHSVHLVDRRDLEWVRADNLSRFLRAARDQYGIRAKDLFHPLDLTDATVEGLFRAVHTILVLQRVAKTHTSVSKPNDKEENDEAPLKKPNTSLLLEKRKQIEKKLVAIVAPEPLVNGIAHHSRRYSWDIPGQSMMGSRPRLSTSITFADNVQLRSSEEEGRLPYRDRKMSESALSLTGVAEEEEHGQGFLGGSTPPDRHSSSMARTTSQRRISQEIKLRSVGGLRSPVISDSADELRLPPVRNQPVRRHSGRSTTLSKPESRDYFTIEDQAKAARVPFPRSNSTSVAISSESPSARRIGRHLSLSATQSVENVCHTPASPRLGTRPALNSRHIRYSSDLHIPRPVFNASRSDVSIDDQTRSRRNSEVGSLYSNPLSGLSDDLSSLNSSRMTRDPSINSYTKHKLVVSNEGQADTTYQLGNCIGRGQFGSVYRALNLNSGQMVAVKRIKLDGRSEDEVTQLMGEVELLKTLVHPSVVKYEGLVRGSDVVSIILEYVENGSLLHTLKAFGNFPEKLVASYVVKILEGLHYLHDMKVVHCDLKAANILTTKNGNVKLSDFGVSLNLKAAEDLKKNDAIGTPNWMAPEVIELKGASTAADIWSLGCTIVELLTGKPPYGDMLAMSAMFRIVEDDHPPLPDDISETLRNFLIQCFQKDPSLRPNAAMLFDHEWLRSTWTDHKALRSQDSVPFLKRISAAENRKSSIRASKGNERMKKVNGRDVDQSRPARPSRSKTQPDALAEMERSSSTPSPTAIFRPDLVAMRTFSAPGDCSSNQQDDGTSEPLSHSPPSSNMVFSSSPSQHNARRGSDVISFDTSIDLLRSPSVMATSDRERNGTEGTSDINGYDANAPDVFVLDEQKSHAFVKSTFSKAVQCKICRESVKKHAVLCEDCGLICHASCAQRASTPCNLRAQLLMLAGHGRSSFDWARNVSPTPSKDRGTPSPQPTLSPPLFRLPFSRYKRNASRGSDVHLPVSPTADIPLSPEPTSPKSNGYTMSQDVANAQRRPRRASLLPSHLVRARSPSPANEQSQLMSRSLSSSNSNNEGSLGYGSSVSSMSSSFGVGSPYSHHSKLQKKQPQISDATPKRQRHLSTSAAFVNRSATYFTGRKSQGQDENAPRKSIDTKTTPLSGWRRPQPSNTDNSAGRRPDQDTRGADRKHIRRLSTKQDCTIM